MPLPDDFTEQIVEGGGIDLVRYKRSPATIQPRGSSVLSWTIDAGPLQVDARFDGQDVDVVDERRVSPTFTRTYALSVSVNHTAYTTLATRTVHVDLTGTLQAAFPLSQLRAPLRAEIRRVLDDNGMSAATITTLRLSASGTASEQDEGTLGVTVVITTQILGILHTFTLDAEYAVTLSDGQPTARVRSTSADVEADTSWVVDLVVSLSQMKILVDQFETLLEGAIALALVPIAESAMDDGIDAAIQPFLAQVPAGFDEDALYALVLGQTITAYVLLPSGNPAPAPMPGPHGHTGLVQRRRAWGGRQRQTSPR